MADAVVLEATEETRAGSSPVSRTNANQHFFSSLYLFFHPLLNLLFPIRKTSNTRNDPRHST